MEGDAAGSSCIPASTYFNPLPPHGGRHRHIRNADTVHIISIHSLRMEGDNAAAHGFCKGCISIHSLRMEGDTRLSIICKAASSISIHSLRMEGDGSGSGLGQGSHNISIHSLRMEGDPRHSSGAAGQMNFNPLPPHGGRPFLVCR